MGLAIGGNGADESFFYDSISTQGINKSLNIFLFISKVTFPEKNKDLYFSCNTETVTKKRDDCKRLQNEKRTGTWFYALVVGF